MRRRALVAIVLITGVVTTLGIGRPASAEMIKFRSQHINVASRFDTLVVGDESGHFIALFQAKGVGVRNEGPDEPPYKIEIWGSGYYQADATGKEHGYGKFTFSDGSSYYEEWTSKAGGGRGVGTAVYYNGTGRFEGMKGGSKFDCTSLGDRFVCEVEGWIEVP